MSRVLGFTLVELLVALSLMTLAMGTMIATFMGGTGLWDRFEYTGPQGQTIVISLEEMTRELHNIRYYEPIAFMGRYDEIAFPSLVKVEPEEGEAYYEIGERRYFLDERDKSLCQSERSYREMRKHFDRRKLCQPLAKGVERLRFKYYEVNLDNGNTTWHNNWDYPTLPIAISIEVTYQDATEEHAHRTQKERIVHLPNAIVR